MKNLLCVCALGLVACGNSTGEPIQGGDDDDGSNGSDGPKPPTPVPLIVATNGGLQIWHDSAGVTSNVAPDVIVTGGALGDGVSALAISGDRLYAARRKVPGGNATDDAKSAVLAFDGANTLAATATPAATVLRVDDINELRIDTADNLWLDENTLAGIVYRYAGASALGNAAAPAATFAHPDDQLPSFAVEPTSQRMFAGQISGSGVVAWNDAMTRTGKPPDDFTLALGAYWQMRIDHDRLYAVGQHMGGGTGVAIWTNASALDTGVPPILVSTGFTTGFVANCAIRNDILVVSARDQHAIMIYKNASALTADRAPDFTITDHVLSPGRIAIDASNRIYVADSGGVVVFDAIDTAPAFVTELAVVASGTTSSNQPNDLVLVE